MFKKILAALIIIMLVAGLSYLGLYLYTTKIKPAPSPVTQPSTSDTQTSNQGELYSSDFSKSQSINDWNIVDDKLANEGPSNWKTDNNALVQLSNIWAGTSGEPITAKSYLGTEAYLKAGMSWSNYEVNAKFNPADNDGIGFIVRYKDQNNYYKVMLMLDSEKENAGPFIKIDRNVGGTFATLYQKNVSYKLKKWNTIKIDVNGPNMDIYLNSDSKTIWATDPDSSFTQGTFGLSCFAEEGVSFKDIVITGIK
jgi:hypothetical protein